MEYLAHKPPISPNNPFYILKFHLRIRNLNELNVLHVVLVLGDVGLVLGDELILVAVLAAALGHGHDDCWVKAVAQSHH